MSFHIQVRLAIRMLAWRIALDHPDLPGSHSLPGTTARFQWGQFFRSTDGNSSSTVFAFGTQSGMSFAITRIQRLPKSLKLLYHEGRALMTQISSLSMSRPSTGSIQAPPESLRVRRTDFT